ncbi:MAG: aldehyde dehydrogenase family protein [Deltaproteobacteria bacterium]|nr:aldehyde dehydrogenase family protein [Deltaproteobacteria bacterium]
MKKYQMFINGKWVDARSSKTMSVMNPGNEEIIAEVPASGVDDVRDAIKAARTTFDSGVWTRLEQKKRSELMLKVVDGLIAKQSELAELESLSSGATVRKSSMIDAPLAVEHFRYFAELAYKKDLFEPLPWINFPSVSWNFVVREPIGVAGQIIPWNFPLLMAVWKIAPAIAAGNCVILKPASYTPLTALELAKIIEEAGIPAGVVNVITGPGGVVGEELATNPMIDKVALTGSTSVGSRVMELASKTVKKVTLELGGKSANIVLADANLDEAVDGALFGTFLHSGQVCESGTRLLVDERIYDKFMDKLVARAKGIKVGYQMEYDTTMGPVVSATQRETVERYIKIGLEEKAKLVLGGRRPDTMKKGFYVEPTIFTDVKNSMKIAQEEIFGPVLSVIRFKTADEAIKIANDSMYGLAGGVWSTDIPHAIEVAKAIRTGTVWINDYHLINAIAPFGGYKQSGIGRELGMYGFDEYTQIKHIHVAVAPRKAKFWYDLVLD